MFSLSVMSRRNRLAGFLMATVCLLLFSLVTWPLLANISTPSASSQRSPGVSAIVNLTQATQNYVRQGWDNLQYSLNSAECRPFTDISKGQDLNGFDECFDLPPSTENFTISVCYDSTACNRFQATIRRRPDLCAQAPDPYTLNISSDAAYVDYAVAQGPDSFLLRTNGAQRYATEKSEYLGDCETRFTVSLANRGDFVLELYWIHGDYWAYRENVPNGIVTERHRDLLSTHPIMMRVCEDPCPAMVAPPEQVVLLPYRPTALESYAACKKDQEVQGVYIPADPQDTHEPPAKLPNFVNGFPTLNKYRWQPMDCKWQHAGLRYSDHSPCTTRNQTVLMFGDSHVRGAYDGIVHRLDGQIGPFVESVKDANKRSAFGNLSLEFRWDRYGDELLKTKCDDFKSIDHLVVGIGTWSSWKDDTTAMWNDKLHEIASHVQNCTRGDGRVNLIFQNLPASPPRTVQYWADEHDRRTNRRHLIWNDLISNIMGPDGWTVLDYHQLTLPLVFEPLATDGSHYYKTDAHDALMDELLGKLGICEVE